MYVRACVPVLKKEGVFLSERGTGNSSVLHKPGPLFAVVLATGTPVATFSTLTWVTVKEPPAEDSQVCCSSSLFFEVTVTLSATRYAE